MSSYAPAPWPSPSLPPSSSPSSGVDTPPTCEVPHFAPVRVRGGRYQLQRLVRHRRRAVAVGLTVTAAAALATGPRETEQAPGRPVADPVRERRAVQLVTAPVRIADGATVRLLRPGDRVDVIAAEQTATGGGARVVARGARVSKLPEALEVPEAAGGGGALVMLSVPRSTAARLAGASTTARLAVTLC
ncbi:hypothetical protein [Streptomyces cellulosae]|uniref:hypothetical protein n=1 Tax=Streptomyces cellulosae TaxID=1968 RepID=UPI00099C1D9D|nr:hypothetical protein [Streptomyces cellulosae]